MWQTEDRGGIGHSSSLISFLFCSLSMDCEGLPRCEYSKQKYQEHLGFWKSSHSELGSEISLSLTARFIWGNLDLKKGNYFRGISLIISSYCETQAIMNFCCNFFLEILWTKVFVKNNKLFLDWIWPFPPPQSFSGNSSILEGPGVPHRNFL